VSETLILNRSGLPFEDESEAYHLASILSRETGRRYRAIPWQSGYGVEAIEAVLPAHAVAGQVFKEIHLRPAIRSQLVALLVLGCFLWASQAMESLLLMLGVDHLRVMLYEVTGSVLAWESIVVGGSRAATLVCLIGLVRILYLLYSRTYFVGPYGVEANYGVISKDQTRIEFKHVRGVKLRQGVVQRLIGYGTLEIATSGSDGCEIRFLDIARPGMILGVLRDRAKVFS
jgi:membrane protein YdbS with pleckstrin-like domain